VNVSSAGAQANGSTYNVALSADGRYVTFTTPASNLVTGHTGTTEDAFRRDRMTNTTILVGVTPGGAQANGTNYGDENNISGDGRFVTTDFQGDNLVSNTAGAFTIVLHDFNGNTNTRIGIKVDGTNFGESSYSYPSDDGLVVVFNAESRGWVRRLSGTPSTSAADLADNEAAPNADTWILGISGDGTRVLFESAASNLVAADGNAQNDLFVRDLVANTTVRVSLADNDSQIVTGSGRGSIAKSGAYVAFLHADANVVLNDTNAKRDVFVRDLSAGTTTRVHVSSTGAQADGDACSFPAPQISSNGRFVVFCSEATNLVANDTNGLADVFVHDRTTGRTVRVSTAENGTEGNGTSNGQIDISDDGRWVAFSSMASNLVPNDDNGFRDAFVARNVLAD
jgi:hypothetical protein